MYKKVRMNPRVLSIMFIGFQRRLFTPPKENDMFSVTEDNFDCTIFFRREFWNNYIIEMEMADNAGKFASSNAAERWEELLSTVYSAVNDELPDNCEDYYLISKKYFS